MNLSPKVQIDGVKRKLMEERVVAFLFWALLDWILQLALMMISLSIPAFSFSFAHPKEKEQKKSVPPKAIGKDIMDLYASRS